MNRQKQHLDPNSIELNKLKDPQALNYTCETVNKQKKDNACNIDRAHILKEPHLPNNISTLATWQTIIIGLHQVRVIALFGSLNNTTKANKKTK